MAQTLLCPSLSDIYKRSERLSVIVSSSRSWAFLSIRTSVTLVLRLPRSEVEPFLELESDQSGFQAPWDLAKC
jgi:hypothetical protein